MQEILAVLGFEKSSMAAGAVGALLAFRFFKGLPWHERLYVALISFPTALYGGEAIGEVFELGPQLTLAAVMVVGAVGIAALAALFSEAPGLVRDLRRKYFGGE